MGMYSIQLGLFISTTAALLGAVVFVLYVDSRGRRFLVLFGTGAVSVAWLGAALCAAVGGLESGRTELYNEESYVLRFLFGAFLCLLAFGYAFSVGPFSWVFCYEVFPFRARAKASAIVTAVHFVGAVVSANVLQSLLDAGKDVVYCLKFFVVVSTMLAMVLYMTVPETKGIFKLNGS